MEMNDTTGLPELPAGQWWNVSRDERRSGSYVEFSLSIQEQRVERMEKGLFYHWAYMWNDHGKSWTAARWGMKGKVVHTLHSDYILNGSGDPELNPTTILATAMKILATVEAEVARQKARDDAEAGISKYLGNYPPKSLKGKS